MEFSPNLFNYFPKYIIFGCPFQNSIFTTLNTFIPHKTIPLLFQNSSYNIQVISFNSIYQIWFKCRNGTDGKTFLNLILESQNGGLFFKVFVEFAEQELVSRNFNQFFTYFFALVFILFRELNAWHPLYILFR